MTSAYLDSAATTRVDPRVAELVVHCMVEDFGNAGSRTHQRGLAARQMVERARGQVATAVDADVTEVIFTSGATESNNIAILGLEDFGVENSRRHIITSAIEHKAVLAPVERLRSRGFEVELVPPCQSGSVDASDVLRRVRKDTLLVSLMHANNETGVIQPIGDVATGIPNDVFLHVDASQTFGKILEPLVNRRIDLISVSGHKIFGPKGVGALIARRRNRKRPPLSPLVVGGGQERGLRAGTQPVPVIVGLGAATEFAVQENASRMSSCSAFKTAIEAALFNIGAIPNGSGQVLPNILNVSIPHLDSEAAILLLKGTAEISNGSACTSDKYEPSHVLIAMDLPRDRVFGALRFSWDHNDDPEIVGSIARCLDSTALS